MKLEIELPDNDYSTLRALAKLAETTLDEQAVSLLHYALIQVLPLRYTVSGDTQESERQ